VLACTCVRRGLGPALLSVASVLAGCGGGGEAAGGRPLDMAKWLGVYVSDTLRDGTQPRVLRAVIGPDTNATMSIEIVGIGTTFHPGRWTARGDRLTMQPTRGDGTPNEVAFRWRLEDGRLVPLAWDKLVYGDRGVTLTKQPPADTSGGAEP
jgi:hypothetical protein